MPELDVDLDMVALEMGRLMLKNLALEKALHAERMQAARTAQINYSKSSGGLDVHIYNPATGLKADCDAFHVVAFGPLS